MTNGVSNVVFAGLGGQGVLKGADILADAVLRAGFDVKKSEIHGMSQRGGSVTSDVRFGERVLSPMVPVGEADYVVVLSPDQVERNRPYLRAGGTLITPDAVPAGLNLNPRSLNVALLGVLSRYLDISEDHWHAAIRANLPEKAHEANLAAFKATRGCGESGK
ncbi:MAG TPA: indolepyruvate oxidoreductase subunit beta [Phycisphaerae bacterium]|jgi:indolepyruvate ferredoxin oxidoreductase beta subunit|nr:indolepyruvate oxidoreductase subunit beta [Phycisphaerae bacterium]HOB74501.1 indolepyruvate oxidoreductase subunit beta [Phycisphaerae bacterium]HOJ54229.1 indolepyruvate oxidoreductase subunit beta [Phycisphaerae bacterium]HOL26580.1 indolepyruvate oxidoreductase subunit beta [Phycisphaerae bacterium]HPP20314.1 indolepyruvate oxidoreductase subunit beta [Phycisphaerae bacterium]